MRSTTTRASIRDDERFDLFLTALDVVSDRGCPPSFRWIAEPLTRTVRLDAPPRQRRRAMPVATAAAAYRRAARGTVNHAPRVTSEPGDRLLVYMPFRRDDYVRLLAPAIREHLALGGHATIVAQASIRRAWERALGPMGADSVAFVESWQGPLDIAKAHRLAEAPGSREHATVFTRELGLSTNYVDVVLDLLVHYWREHLWFSRILQNVQPSAILGIHFVLSPGVRGAIDEHRCDRRKPMIALVQHGVFDHAERFHDFANTDIVALWGSHWVTELGLDPEHPSYTKPVSLVSGHPTLSGVASQPDASASTLADSSERSPLWIHSPGTAPDTERAILEAMWASGSRTIRIKPHPREARNAFAVHMRALGVDDASVVLDPGVSMRSALESTSCAIGTSSTALLDAVAMSVPVAVYDDGRQRVPSWITGSFRTFADAGALTAWIRAIETRTSNAGLDDRLHDSAMTRLLGIGERSKDDWPRFIHAILKDA